MKHERPQEIAKMVTRDRRVSVRRSLVVCGIAAALAFALQRRPCRAPAPLRACPAPTQAPAPVAQEPPPPVTYTVRRGDTFAGILAQLGVMERTAAVCFRRMREFGLVSLFPGDSLVVRLCRAGNLTHLALCNRRQFWYHISSENDTMRMERRPVETTVQFCTVKGTLTRSLSEDVWELGEGDALVAAFADIFAWDINFFTDPRIGDRFEVLFEKKYAEGTFVGYGRILAARYRTTDNREFSAYALPDSAGRIRYYAADGRSVRKEFLKAPLRYSRISSRYSHSRKHPVLGIYRPHFGVDYAAPAGTPVYAAADGTVEYAGWNGDYGNQVTIRHGAAYTTSYGHLQRICPGIVKGVRVTQGRMIGTVGSSGLASGPHLDYRMRINGRYVNPLTVALPSGVAIPDPERPAFERIRAWCAIMLDMRIADRTGSYVLEVVNTPATDTRVVSFSLLSHTTDTAGDSRRQGFQGGDG